MNIITNRPTITRKELESMLNCLINEELIDGNTIKSFEKIFCELVKLKYSLATNSLMSAYHLCFEAMDIGDHDEVIIPSYFDIAPLSALSLSGGKAILTDIEKGYFYPSIDQIKKKLSKRTKAIVIGHLLGFNSYLDELKSLNIPIIEDISHSIGIEINGKPIGGIGTFTVASFAPSMMITTGNGGIVLTNNSKLHSFMKDKRDNNIKNNNISFDYCLTDFQGAMGISQLSKLNDFIKRRRMIAKKYYDSLKFASHKTPFQCSRHRHSAN